MLEDLVLSLPTLWTQILVCSTLSIERLVIGILSISFVGCKLKHLNVIREIDTLIRHNPLQANAIQCQILALSLAILLIVGLIKALITIQNSIKAHLGFRCDLDLDIVDASSWLRRVFLPSVLTFHKILILQTLQALPKEICAHDIFQLLL